MEIKTTLRRNAFWLAFASCLFVASSFGQTYEVVHAFKRSGRPLSNLIQASDGYLYGTTYWGGASGVGTIFRLDAAQNFTTVHSFGYADGANPAAGLIQATDGNFYGTTSLGGRYNRGAVFRMDSSFHVTTLHSFEGADGAHPNAALVQAADGNFYGTTVYGGESDKGTVFGINSSGSLTILHSFNDTDGAFPFAALVAVGPEAFVGATCYGGSDGSGTVFVVNVWGGFDTLHTFDGSYGGGLPRAALVLASDGSLYGTTQRGGEYGDGTAFRIGSAEFSVLHSFRETIDGAYPEAALIQGENGQMYGTTLIGGAGWGGGTVFQMSLEGDVTTLQVFDGTNGTGPSASLFQAPDGTLFGTTVAGSNGCWAGSVFKLDASGNLVTLHSFIEADGASPEAALVEASDGRLYGTASSGANLKGVVYRISSSSDFTILHDFTGVDGSSPKAALIQTADGTFYGATQGGGAHDQGTVFRMDPWGNVVTLYSFDGATGAGPIAALTPAADGTFYGTTIGGGANGAGTVFKIDFAGSFTALHSFDGEDGQYPRGLVWADDGDFYGVTSGGGANALGTLFKMNSSAEITTLHNFSGPDGSTPVGALIQADDGNFYGTTDGGGDDGKGTVFRMNPSGDLTTLHSFHGTDGQNPRGSLIQASDGRFYGTTAGSFYGTTAGGTVFRMDVDGDVTTLHDFNGTDGSTPLAGVIEASDGSLYGTTLAGGPLFDPNPYVGVSRGVVFRLSSTSIALNEATPTSGPASGGAALDVLGGGFAAAATVSVGGVAGTDVTVLDPTFLYLFTPALSPGTLNDVSVSNPGSSSDPVAATLQKAFFADFLDVSQLNIFHDYVEKIFRKGVTAGCAAGSYCPDNSVTRAQMAVFLLKSEHGSSHVPPACAGVFGDVACPSLFADWIEELASEGITAGCGAGNYCPGNPVTRAQMAVFLLKTEHGPGYLPPPCTGAFLDVACPSLFADWIEQLESEKVTAGCGGGNYCPGSPNTRGQMAVFLARTFHL